MAKATEKKPGYKSTEFWGSMTGAAALIESAQAFSNEWVQGLCIFMAGAAILWYTAKRTEAKS